MSIMRASGAMPIITALQIATASFAVPKSVMKTIVGRAAVFFAALSGWFACPPQPANPNTAKSRIAKTPERLRKNCTASPLRAWGKIGFQFPELDTRRLQHTPLAFEASWQPLNARAAASCDTARKARDAYYPCWLAVR